MIVFRYQERKFSNADLRQRERERERWKNEEKEEEEMSSESDTRMSTERQETVGPWSENSKCFISEKLKPTNQKYSIITY